jgi:prolyl-tRNA editing enzyme YbaK/EbsC (Cys-tRNA(Pro) deacylase)
MSYYPHVEHILERASVKRAQEAMDRLKVSGRIHALSESARTAQEAADSLGVEVGQIASSLIFNLPSGGALLIITSGRHRVDTDLVAKNLGIEKLTRVDADFVKEISGYSIGGVPHMGNKSILLRWVKLRPRHNWWCFNLPKLASFHYGGV